MNRNQKSYGRRDERGTRNGRSNGGEQQGRSGGYQGRSDTQRANGYNRERFEQGRRQSAAEAEARRAAREAQQEAAADAWHEKNVLAFRVPKRFTNVMLTKTVVEVFKDPETGRMKEKKKIVQTVEEVYAANDSDALMLAMKRQPSFEKAFVVVAR